MPAPRLLTLPQVARAVGVEYRTLHSWLRRGLLRPSMQASSGTGIPNLFTVGDAVRAKVIADLRRSGVSLDRLEQAGRELDEHPDALTDGAMILVNGSVAIVDAHAAANAIERESLSLIYNTRHAVREINEALTSA